MSASRSPSSWCQATRWRLVFEPLGPVARPPHHGRLAASAAGPPSRSTRRRAARSCVLPGRSQPDLPSRVGSYPTMRPSLRQGNPGNLRAEISRRKRVKRAHQENGERGTRRWSSSRRPGVSFRQGGWSAGRAPRAASRQCAIHACRQADNDAATGVPRAVRPPHTLMPAIAVAIALSLEELQPWRNGERATDPPDVHLGHGGRRDVGRAEPIRRAILATIAGGDTGYAYPARPAEAVAAFTRA